MINHSAYTETITQFGGTLCVVFISSPWSPVRLQQTQWASYGKLAGGINPWPLPFLRDPPSGHRRRKDIPVPLIPHRLFNDPAL